MSIVTYIEASQGTLRVPDPAAGRGKLEWLVGIVPIVGFSPAVARRCAAIREALRRQGRRADSRSLDLVIAATAVEHDLTLVTRKLHDFRGIPNLRLHPSS